MAQTTGRGTQAQIGQGRQRLVEPLLIVVRIAAVSPVEPMANADLGAATIVLVIAQACLPGILFCPARPPRLVLRACGAKKNASSPRRPPPCPINCPRHSVLQGLVRALLIVIREVPPQPLLPLRHRLVPPQVEVLVLVDVGFPSNFFRAPSRSRSRHQVVRAEELQRCIGARPSHRPRGLGPKHARSWLPSLSLGCRVHSRALLASVPPPRARLISCVDPRRIAAFGFMCRGRKAAIELFLAGFQSWNAGMRRILSRHRDGVAQS